MTDTARGGSEAPPSAVRLRAVRIIAWVMAFVTAVLLFGIIDLATLPGWANPAYEWSVPLEVSWGSLFTFVLAGSFVSIALDPARSWPGIVQLAVASGGLVLSSVMGLDARPMAVAALIAASVLVIAGLTRKAAGTSPRVWKLSWQYLLIAAAGVPLWLSYALYALEMSRQGRSDDTSWGIEHWPVQGAVGLTLGLSAVLMAAWVPGRALMRLTTSVSATFIGAAMLAYPDRAGAMDSPMWGVAMVIWGTLLALPLPQAAPAPTPSGSAPAQA